MVLILNSFMQIRKFNYTEKGIIFLILLLAGNLQAQRYEILSGDLKNIIGITEYNISFDYKDQQVNGFESEAAYLKEKIGKRQQYDHGQDLQGKAKKFEKDWYEDRQNKYEPGFIDYFNSRLVEEKVVVSKNPSAKYTINVKTTWVYPGYEVANVEPAKISAIITFSETSNPTNVLVSVFFDKSIGIVKDYRGQGDRIKGAYEKLAKSLTIQMKRFL